MSSFASVPTRFGDMRRCQNSRPPKVSKIFGQVLVARQRSSKPAVAVHGRASSPDNRSTTAPLRCPARTRVALPPATAKRKFIASCRARDVRIRAIPHDASRFILIEAEMDKAADEIAGLRIALADAPLDLSPPGCPASLIARNELRSRVAA